MIGLFLAEVISQSQVDDCQLYTALYSQLFTIVKNPSLNKLTYVKEDYFPEYQEEQILFICKVNFQEDTSLPTYRFICKNQNMAFYTTLFTFVFSGKFDFCSIIMYWNQLMCLVPFFSTVKMFFKPYELMKHF